MYSVAAGLGLVCSVVCADCLYREISNPPNAFNGGGGGDCIGIDNDCGAIGDSTDALVAVAVVVTDAGVHNILNVDVLEAF